MRSAQSIEKAVYKLSNEKLRNRQEIKLTYAEVAKEAGVHWTTVQRYFGNKENMIKVASQISTHQSLPSATKEDTKQKILRAARKVFSKNGYERSTLDDVAKEAGLTKGALYWNFSTKQALYLELVHQSLTELIGRLPAETETIFSSSHPQEVLQLLFQKEFSNSEQDKGERAMLFLEFMSRSSDELVRSELQLFFANLIDSTSAFIKNFQGEKKISNDIEARNMAITMHALMNGLVLMWLVAPNKVPLSSMARDVSKIVWKGIKPESER